ncbi:MAG: hypothetical protein KIT33_08705 [Candidatus Kapabacteria bacterium]|nr:hypothetical protein [Candidatus Kapabacteria bacterium]
MMGEIGIVESRSNKGIVEKYLQSVGLPAGNPYCAAGQYYCFVKATKILNLSNKEIPIPKTGLSRKILSYAKMNGKNVPNNPKRHDLIIWRMRGSSWRGHIERVIETGKAGWVKTVGFNVRLESGEEGVAIKRRNIYHLIGRLEVAGLVGFCGVEYD